VESVRRGEGEESRSWRRDAAVGVEMKRAKAAAEGRRRSGEEVRRREDSSLEAPPMAAAAAAATETWRGVLKPWEWAAQRKRMVGFSRTAHTVRRTAGWVGG
jgi:hypothetical protein